MNRELIHKMNELMISNRKKYIVMKDDGSYRTIAFNNFRLVDSTLEKHLSGEKTIGIFSGNYLTKFICFDVDTKSNSERDTRHLVNTLVEEHNINRNDIYISLSGNKGFHVEIYLDKCITLKLARKFYEHVLSNAGFNSRKVELRPTNNQGLKLPLGIHKKTGKRCWYVDQHTYKPIENFDYILNIKPISAEYFELEYSNVEPIILDKSDAIVVQESINSLNINIADIENNLRKVKTILEEGVIHHSGTRNDATLALAIYLKTQGYDKDIIISKIKDIMLRSKRNLRTITSSEDTIINETVRIVDVTFKYDYKLAYTDKEVKIYRDEVENLLNIKEKHLKQLYLIHLIASKRYAKQNGTYFLTYEFMSRMGATKNRLRLADYILELEKREYLEVINKKVWDIDLLYSKGEFRYKPNVYRVKKIVTSDSDIDSITIRDNQELDLDCFLKEVDCFFTDIDLKEYLPNNHFYKIKNN